MKERWDWFNQFVRVVLLDPEVHPVKVRYTAPEVRAKLAAILDDHAVTECALAAAEATCAAYREALEAMVRGEVARERAESIGGHNARRVEDFATMVRRQDAFAAAQALLASPDPAQAIAERLAAGQKLVADIRAALERRWALESKKDEAPETALTREVFCRIDIDCALAAYDKAVGPHA